MTDANPVLDALKLVSDGMHELITINTALIGVTVTFRKEFFGNTAPWQRLTLAGIFLALVLSIVFSLLTLNDVVGAAANPQAAKPAQLFDPSSPIIVNAEFAAGFFLAAIIGYCVVGAVAIGMADATDNKGWRPPS